jgi:DNA-binding PadR family transcriptional regulator
MGNFTMIPNEVIEHAGLSPQELSVYVALALHANYQTRRCNPGFARIGEVARVSRETVKRSVKSLESRGLISVERHKVGSRNDVNVYTLRDLGSVRAHPLGNDRAHMGSPKRDGRAQREPRTRTINKTRKRDASRGIASTPSQLDDWLAKRGVSRVEYEQRKAETGWLESLRELS